MAQLHLVQGQRHRHRLHISRSLFFHGSYCRKFLPSIFERALLLVSPPSPADGMSNCKRICVTANQHDASSIVKLNLPLNLPAPRNDSMTQKTSKNPQCGFPYRPYVLPPFSSDSILVRAGRNFSRKISCSNAVRGIFRWLLSRDLPFHLGIGHHGHHHYKHSFASRDIKFLGATFC